MALPPYNLPPELWLKIFTYLPRSDLTQVSVASHQMAQIATPCLYGEVVVIHDKNVTSFLKSAEANPTLRNLVLNLRLEIPNYPENTDG